MAHETNIDVYCNAPLQSRNNKGKFCKKQAGEGTTHLGEGHCFMHGGEKAVERKKSHAPFLEAAARGLSTDELENLYDMSNRGLILARAMAVQRLVNPNVSSKEASDLTMAIQRIDKVLESFPVGGDDDPDAAPNSGDVSPLDAEYQRLVELES